MIKYFCDLCGREIVYVGDLKNPKYFTHNDFKAEINISKPKNIVCVHICTDCTKKIVIEGAYCLKEYGE